MEINEIINFVHKRGKWQSENCYETRVDIIKDTMIIANYNKYGSKEEREICHDSVVIQINKKDHSKGSLISVDNFDINLRTLMEYDWVFESKYYQYYIIELKGYKKDE